jgi:hypothetical protein
VIVFFICTLLASDSLRCRCFFSAREGWGVGTSVLLVIRYFWFLLIGFCDVSVIGEIFACVCEVFWYQCKGLDVRECQEPWILDNNFVIL